MKLTYQTGVATLIQFITLSILGFANGVNSAISACRSDEDCIVNIILSIIVFILTACWFAIVWMLGYLAQERRSRNVAFLLIGAEALIILVALVNAKGHTDALSLTTSVIDIILALWIITLAFRLMRSGGKRITTSQRSRKRRHSNV